MITYLEIFMLHHILDAKRVEISVVKVTLQNGMDTLYVVAAHVTKTIE